MMVESILVVGGSGMLAKLCCLLAKDNSSVTVLGRNVVRLNAVKDLAPSKSIETIACDYRDKIQLDEIFRLGGKITHRFEMVVCWSHDNARFDIPHYFAEFCSKKFVHVVGSTAASPAKSDYIATLRNKFSKEFPTLAYQIVILGFVKRPYIPISRWLTHNEISDGVYSALSKSTEVSVIGTVEPWSMRP